jgi:hypothetical protein
MARRNLVSDLQSELKATEARAAALRSAIRALSGVPSPFDTSEGGRRASSGEAAPASTPGRRKRSRLSAAARKRISDAQKARWAKQRAKKD